MKDAKMSATESVKAFLDTYSEVEVYFNYCYEVMRDPNYSEFRRKYLVGTTAEGYSFSSIEIKYADITEYLRKRYIDWKRRG